VKPQYCCNSSLAVGFHVSYLTAPSSAGLLQLGHVVTSVLPLSWLLRLCHSKQLQMLHMLLLHSRSRSPTMQTTKMGW
jgi:hypothetical protein